MHAMKKLLLPAIISLLLLAPCAFGQAGASSSTAVGAFPNTLGMKLRKLAAAAQTNNPLINTPLGPAPAWVATTAYVQGQVVVNGGYQYICSVAGTSAASGGPTGQGFAPIIDNTVTWFYYGSRRLRLPPQISR